MVTKIHKGGRKRLFLKEHRIAHKVSAEAMAGRLGIERESVHRWEREHRRVNAEKQAAYADALGIEPAALWSPPGTHSLDALVAKAPEDLKITAFDIVRRLMQGDRTA